MNEHARDEWNIYFEMRCVYSYDKLWQQQTRRNEIERTEAT